MEEKGRIRSIKGDIAEIAFIKKSGCGGNCSSCKTPCSRDMVYVDVKNTLNAKVGDEVIITVTDSAFKSMTFWAYVVPTIMTLIGLFGGVAFFKYLNLKDYELYGAITAFVFLVLAYLISSKLNKKAKDGSYTFTMKEKIN